MLAHLFETFIWNPSSPSDVLQEGKDISWLLRSAKRHQQDCIERGYRHVSHQDLPHFLLEQLPAWASSSRRRQMQKFI